MTTADAFLDPLLRVFGPDGTKLKEVAAFSGNPAILEGLLLPQSGLYTIICSDGGGDEKATYAVHLAVIPSQNGADEAGGNIEPNTTTVGSLPLGDVDVFTFLGSAGQSATIQMSTASAFLDLRLRLFGPDGIRLAEATSSSGNPALLESFKLNESGTYTILCSERQGDEAAAYAINLALIPSLNSVSIMGGELKRGTNTVGDVDVYSFNGSAGQRATIQLTTADSFLDPLLRIFGPDGAKLKEVGTFSGNPAIVDSLLLPKNGVYTVMCSDQGGDETAGYAVDLGYTESKPS